MSRLVKERVNGPRKLRELLSSREILLAPGAFDALSARLVEFTGFEVVYMTGFGTSAGLLGYPDVGLLTMTEMVDNARRIVDAVNIPVIADADTGYGNPINVIRTIQEYERAGVAGIHIEDQVFPKKCGHISGKEVIPADDMVQKIGAAKDVKSPDFLLIARTDAIAVEGLDSALERARQYYRAGADMIFVEAPENLEQIETISRELKGIPLLFNWAEGGKTPPVSLDTLRRLGFKLVIFPVSTLLSATLVMKSVLEQIRKDGTPLNVMDKLYPFKEFLNFIGLPEVQSLEKRYVTH
ncbi:MULTISPECIES: isocitrate lyase/PEP mutase family protein [Metallosphaera]|uniref:Carboxyvinyl-carboxyphosphonate phosphorylmutase n=1 Tax=Metallosphaera prunae TaxID=47304 RepID=A0A4D8S2D1_METPR|nr:MULTISPECIES: oxaloacetate decarboxylase [Metallosphaera]QCO29105.1 carboxyvinyl-carboxyphosphonate phosphorylmutase [Metallosphaera prunae]BBL47317.1 isocitrate lyase [Metallosphaera sedula]